MIDLGIVKPGSTIRIPFTSFAASTGAPSATTNFAAADILIYKDGNTTERASTSGFTATADFDSKTGINLAIIDLSDNTTAGFYASGSEYIICIGDVTIDSQAVRFSAARFRVGLPEATLNTTVATLASQTSFTLTSGPAEDDAINGCVIYFHDVASAVQGGYAVVSDYTGSTKTVTLAAATTYTVAATDNVHLFRPVALATSQPLYTPAKAGDSMEVGSTSIISILQNAIVYNTGFAYADAVAGSVVKIAADGSGSSGSDVNVISIVGSTVAAARLAAAQSIDR